MLVYFIFSCTILTPHVCVFYLIPNMYFISNMSWVFRNSVQFWCLLLELSQIPQIMMQSYKSSNTSYASWKWDTQAPHTSAWQNVNFGVQMIPSLRLGNLLGQLTKLGNHFTYDPVQFSSVTQSCQTLCDPMTHSTPGLPVHHHLPEFTQTHVHRVSDAIQPSHPLSSPFPPAPMPGSSPGGSREFEG